MRRTDKICRFEKLNIEGYLFIKLRAIEHEIWKLDNEKSKLIKVRDLIKNYAKAHKKIL
jgi:hypothetical protein